MLPVKKPLKLNDIQLWLDFGRKCVLSSSRVLDVYFDRLSTSAQKVRSSVKKPHPRSMSSITTETEYNEMICLSV